MEVRVVVVPIHNEVKAVPGVVMETRRQGGDGGMGCWISVEGANADAD